MSAVARSSTSSFVENSPDDSTRWEVALMRDRASRWSASLLEGSVVPSMRLSRVCMSLNAVAKDIP